MNLKEFLPNITKNELDKFDVYEKLLLTYNEKFNLTAITNHDEIIIKHFYDSILPFADVPKYTSLSLIDVGAGAGFPSIPLKIMYPNLKVTIVESNSKKVMFLNEVIKALDLQDVKVILGRAEDIAKTNRGTYDIAIARALAHFSILVELLVAFPKVNGKIIAMRGKEGLNELHANEKVLKTFDLVISNVFEYELPDKSGLRYSVYLSKKSETKKRYPRDYGTIVNHPL